MVAQAQSSPSAGPSAGAVIQTPEATVRHLDPRREPTEVPTPPPGGPPEQPSADQSFEISEDQYHELVQAAGFDPREQAVPSEIDDEEYVRLRTEAAEAERLRAEYQRTQDQLRQFAGTVQQTAEQAQMQAALQQRQQQFLGQRSMAYQPLLAEAQRIGPDAVALLNQAYQAENAFHGWSAQQQQALDAHYRQHYEQQLHRLTAPDYAGYVAEQSGLPPEYAGYLQGVDPRVMPQMAAGIGAVHGTYSTQLQQMQQQLDALTNELAAARRTASRVDFVPPAGSAGLGGPQQYRPGSPQHLADIRRRQRGGRG